MSLVVSSVISTAFAVLCGVSVKNEEYADAAFFALMSINTMIVGR